MASASDTIHRRLSSIIPKGSALHYHHLSTPPTRCAALYNPPPQTPPEKTYCESHTLLVSGNASQRHVAIFAIKIQIYTTSRLTTIFVSKADSTGYAPLLDIPKTPQSLLQSITSIFVSWIVRHRHRADRRLVVSLFARAQDQYLFPGSVQNKRKHVLSDRQLVKWWCKTLDPVLREYNAEDPTSYATAQSAALQDTSPSAPEPNSITSQAYLIVPGHDRLETTHFFPPSYRDDRPSHRRWSSTSPLLSLTPYPGAAPRSQIPHFPDDPKSRFLDELDEEIADAPAPSSSERIQSENARRQDIESPRKKRGQWRSARTLEQFWEMMAFRQECASGRLVGFLWLVFTPEEQVTVENGEKSVGSLMAEEQEKGTNVRVRQEQRRKQAKRKLPLTGPIILRQPRVKGRASSNNLRFKTTKKYWHIPPHTTGQLILPQKSYDRVHDILLRLDFANLDVAAASTRKWVEEVAIISGKSGTEWGAKVEGLMEVPAATAEIPARKDSGTSANVLQVKRKPKPCAEAGSANDAAHATNASASSVVNVLSPNLVRKKRPAEDNAGCGDKASSAPQGPANGVNMLDAGLVRKKAKT